MISSKKKFPSSNTMFVCPPDVLVMAIDKTYHGSVHYTTLLRGLLPQLGEFAKMLQEVGQAYMATLPALDEITPQVTSVNVSLRKDKKKAKKSPDM